jgi:hypothetical protein
MMRPFEFATILALDMRCGREPVMRAAHISPRNTLLSLGDSHVGRLRERGARGVRSGPGLRSDGPENRRGIQPEMA